MKVPEKLGAEYYRGTLSEQGMTFYDSMNDQFLREDYSGKTSFQITVPDAAASDCFAAFKAIRDDHPEYFFLGYQSEFIRKGRVGILKYPILYRPDLIRRIRRQMRKSISRLVRGTANFPMLERERIVYERIARELMYFNHNDVRDHNIVGPVLLSSGVCEGHNALLMLCFRRIGIPCIKVYGKTESDRWHCWTIAWINAVPVHCDVTWDRAKDGIVRFDYLNLSDKQISGDHFDFQGKQIPVCISEKLNYYYQKGAYVRSFHDLKQRIRREARNGKSQILLHFSYIPPAGDLCAEVKKAMKEVQIYGKHWMFYRKALGNLAVIKL